MTQACSKLQRLTTISTTMWQTEYLNTYLCMLTDVLDGPDGFSRQQGSICVLISPRVSTPEYTHTYLYTQGS
eukprot:9027977-Pyramimonas_sp.AAC.1